MLKPGRKVASLLLSGPRLLDVRAERYDPYGFGARIRSGVVNGYLNTTK